MNSSVWSDIINLAAIYTIYAVSVNLLVGWAGIPAVVPTAFGAAGGFGAAWLVTSQHWSVPLAALAALVTGGIVGFILSGPSLRLAIEYVILLTLAAASVILGVIQNIGALGGQTGLFVPKLTVFGDKLTGVKDFLPWTIGLAVISYLVVRWMGDSVYGIVLKGIREDELAVGASGFNTVSARTIAFTVSAAMSGLAGSIYVFYNGVASPSTFGFTQGILIVTMVIIGGLGRPIGPVVGAVLINLVPRVLQHVGGLSASTSAQVQQIVFGLLLVAVVIVRPVGLLAELPSPIVRRYMAKLNRSKSASGDAAATTSAVSLEEELDAISPTIERDVATTKASVDSLEPVLSARVLRKRFGGLVVADGFDFELPAGQIVGLVGPNGAGKTTLFNLLTGAVRPDSGAVSLFGKDITGLRIDQIVAAGMVRSFQDVRIIAGLTVLENVLLGSADARCASLWRSLIQPGAVRRETKDALDRAYAALDLVKMKDKPLVLGGALSFGEQKLVVLARAIATDAQVLLLDEPAAGVGSDVSNEILELISRLGKQGRTILLVEHNLEVVRNVATSIYFLEAGSIRAHGTYDELTSDPDLAASYFGTVATDKVAVGTESTLPADAKVANPRD
jgi:branched-chain amino acid transport system permease protein